MKILFSAGEASGDAYAAVLAKKLLAREPSLKILGVGGSRLRAAGASMIADSSKWGALGILEAIKVGPRVIFGYHAIKNALRISPPGIFVPIDFGYANIKLCGWAKKLGWKVLYFIPPGSWRKDKQGTDLPRITDEIVTPFSWSAQLLTKSGASAHFFGHPLKQMIREAIDVSGGWNREMSQIAILPGSREHEWIYNLPVIAATVDELNVHCEFAVAPTVNIEILRRTWSQHAPSRNDDQFTVGDTYGVLSRSRAGIICSGTATLEAALCGCPHVVVYRGSKLMEFEFHLRKPQFDYFALPNILLDQLVVPELLQTEATPERILAELEHLVPDGEQRQAQISAFRSIDGELGPSHAIDETVELIMKMVASGA